MGFDLNKCYSHPGKLLKVHLENVASLSKRFTSSHAAELSFISQGEFTMMDNGDFETKGFIIANKHKLKIIDDDFRIGFDKVPTYQNNDFWNLPEKYVNVIYPECSHVINVEGDYWEYIHDKEIEQWVLI